MRLTLPTLSALQAGGDALGVSGLGLAAIVGIVLFYYFVGRGFFIISENQIGILIRKNFGTKMPQGQVIARHGQIGVQAAVLQPSLYWRFPIFWSWKKATITEILPEEVGLVESIDGLPLQKGRLLGDEVECNSFQDAEKFLENGGTKGPQVAILRPGRYRINALAFYVTKSRVTTVDADRTGLVTALDGIPIPSRLIIAPEPITVPDAEHARARTHSFFQDGQAFIDSGGYRGPQLATLQPGRYYINPLLFLVEVIEQQEIPPGYVAVLRSNVGEELERPEPVQIDTTEKDKITHDIENVLITDKKTRGIYREPIAPGKYNLNTHAYTAYLVPTSAVMVDWASSDRPSAPILSRPNVAPKKDDSDYPYLTDPSTRGEAYFRFNQLKVTSKDGFQLEVDVRMVIRILPESASFVVARFGSVFNLIQQIVHPLIDASFRNNAGEKGALEFVQGRTLLQREALERALEVFKDYRVEAQNLLISYIDIPVELLATQTNRQVAVQQQAQFMEQAKAQEQRIAVEARKAQADKQPEVISAQLQVQINENKAKALVKESEGIRDSTRIKADGEASAIRRVGEATADAYHAQADVLGSDRVALVKVIEEVSAGSPVRITPDILLTAGKDGASGTETFQAYLAMLLQQGKSAAPAKPYVPRMEKDYESSLTDEPDEVKSADDKGSKGAESSA